MALRKLHKVSSLPVTKDANALYFVQNGTNSDFYITDSSWTAHPVVTDVRINELVTTAISAQNMMEIVPDISARDALSLSSNALVLVLNATGDATVSSWWATYAYRHSDTSFNKIAEHESQDVVLSWSNIVWRPASSTADIDDAVNKKHTHSNLTTLDKFTENAWEVSFNWDKINSWNTLDW